MPPIVKPLYKVRPATKKRRAKAVLTKFGHETLAVLNRRAATMDKMLRHLHQAAEIEPEMVSLAREIERERYKLALSLNVNLDKRS